MLTVTVAIPGKLNETWKAVNQGHPDTGKHDPDDDLRTYEVTGPDGETFNVNHCRGDGANALAIKILQTSEASAAENRERSGRVPPRPTDIEIRELPELETTIEYDNHRPMLIASDGIANVRVWVPQHDDGDIVAGMAEALEEAKAKLGYLSRWIEP